MGAARPDRIRSLVSITLITASVAGMVLLAVGIVVLAPKLAPGARDWLTQ